MEGTSGIGASVGRQRPTRCALSVWLGLLLTVAPWGPGALWAQQQAPAQDPASPEDDPEAAAQDLPQPVTPIRPTHPDTAYVLEPRVLHLETGYAIHFVDDPLPNLHIWDIYTALGVIDLLEVRLGWDVVNGAGGEVGVGDLRLGLKGGFLGGFDERTALAGLFTVQLPSGGERFGIGSGTRFIGGLVATTTAGPVELDVQAVADLHLFTSHPRFLLPLSAALTWRPTEPFRISADAVLGLDLENLSHTQTSILGGLGYRIIPPLEVNAGVRVGLSTTVPNIVLQLGVAWQVGRLW